MEGINWGPVSLAGKDRAPKKENVKVPKSLFFLSGPYPKKRPIFRDPRVLVRVLGRVSHCPVARVLASLSYDASPTRPTTDAFTNPLPVQCSHSAFRAFREGTTASKNRLGMPFFG